MDVTIRNIDEVKFRQLKARAALLDKSLGTLVSEAIDLLISKPIFEKSSSFKDLPVFSLGADSRNLSLSIDQLVYGKK